nr:reverse transcriptase domain-containing protein [Tanacetum cinerariifolium]
MFLIASRFPTPPLAYIVEPLRIELPFLEDQFQEDPPEDPPEVPMADNRTTAELLQAPTEGYEDAIVIPEIAANNFELKHGLLNSDAGGNFLDKMPRECLKIIESKSKVRQSRANAVVAKVSTSSSTPAVSSEVFELKDMVRALLLDKKNQSSAPAQSSTPAPVKAIKPNYVTCGDTHSDVAYQGPTIPTPSKVVKQGTEVTKDQVQTPSSQSTAPVQPLVIRSETQTPVFEPVVAPVTVLMPKLKPSIPYPSRRDNEIRRDQANEQIKKFYEIFKDMSFEISFTDALILMPKFASTLKALIGNKEKLSEMARTPMNEHCSATGRALIDVHKGELTLQYSQEVLGFSDVTASGNPTPYDDPIVSTTSPTLTSFGDSDFLLFEEADAFVGLEDDPNSLKINPFYYDPEGDIHLLEAILNSKPLPPLPNHEQYLPSFKKELKVCEAKTVKSSVDEPPEVELKNLPPHLEYAFLEGDNKLPVIIAKECMLASFHAMVEKMIEVFMDDFLVFGNSFENCLSRLDKMLQRSKVNVIAKLPHPTTFKDCIKAFQMLKKKLTEAPILTAPNWDLPFKIMCNTSDFAIGVVLGQHHEKHFKPIHYASKTMNDAESNYTTTEKEMLAVVYAFEKFRSYLIMNKSIVHTDHSALKYLFAKKDAKARLLRWVLLLQEFDFKFLDTKGAENLAADHLSQLENLYENVLDLKEINDKFPLETLSMVTFCGDSCAPWFADFANYHAGNFIVKGPLHSLSDSFY